MTNSSENLPKNSPEHSPKNSSEYSSENSPEHSLENLPDNPLEHTLKNSPNNYSEVDELKKDHHVGEKTLSAFDFSLNLTDVRRDFFADAEIFPGRPADAVLRRAKPLEIPNAKSYEEVMLIENSNKPLAERFNLDTDDFPRFSKQVEKYGSRENPKERSLDINDIASRYTGETLKTVDALRDSDLVIYLDKSARPVSWLVNEFWEEFSDRPRPAEAFLAIDRKHWFNTVGVAIDNECNITDSDGKKRKATINDFLAKSDNLPDDTIARIRALFIPGGIKAENVQDIMSADTGLEDKTMTVIDEVKNSGSTLDIATWLLERALPELKVIQKHTFWNPLSLHSERIGEEAQMGASPVWYDPKKHDNWSGRGVLDLNPSFFEENYRRRPNNYTRAHKFGSNVLGEPMNVEQEIGQPSINLQKEIRDLHSAYRRGEILPFIGNISDEGFEKIEARNEKLGIIFAPLENNRSSDANKYAFLAEKISAKSPRKM